MQSTGMSRGARGARVFIAAAIVAAIAAMVPSQADAHAGIDGIKVEYDVVDSALTGTVSFRVGGDCLRDVAVDVVTWSADRAAPERVARIHLPAVTGGHRYTYDGTGSRAATEWYSFVLMARDCAGGADNWDTVVWVTPAFLYERVPASV